MSDLEDPFIPLPQEALMLNVKEDRERIDIFLDKLITMYYNESRGKLPFQTCQGSAMSACLQLLKGTGGRVMVFSANTCMKGVGLLKSRDKALSYNKPEEAQLFQHTNDHEYYRKLCLQALESNVTFDLYFGVKQNLESIDLASVNKAV